MRPTPTSSSPGAWAGCSMASTTRAEPPPSTPCGQLPPPTRPPTASPSPRPHGSPPPAGAEHPHRPLRIVARRLIAARRYHRRRIACLASSPSGRLPPLLRRLLGRSRPAPNTQLSRRGAERTTMGVLRRIAPLVASIVLVI